jgi:CRP-like cAMP-binding protein
MARSGCPTVVAKVRLAEFLQLAADHPAIQRALRKELACQEIILQQWTLNIGQRRARARIAALLLELEARSARAGLVQDGTFQLPATQDVLASALGLSLVHFSKSLASLRDENLVYTAGRSVNLLRPEALRRLTHFDPIYLETEAVIPRLPTLVSSLAEVAA